MCFVILFDRRVAGVVESPTRPCTVTVQDDDQLTASAAWSINRSFGSGYLVSDGRSPDDAGRLAGCATERSPLRISVRHGQRLNFTVFDFGYGRYRPAAVAAGSGAAAAAAVVPQTPETASECGHFLVVAEPKSRRRMKICPSGWRMRGGAYISNNNTVDVYFKRMSEDGHRFLVQFSGK